MNREQQVNNLIQAQQQQQQQTSSQPPPHTPTNDMVMKMPRGELPSQLPSHPMASSTAIIPQQQQFSTIDGTQPQTPPPTSQQLQQVVQQNAPKVIKVRLSKKNNGLGLSIVAARGSNQITGIYVKSVVAGGAAADDGRLAAGDQLLAVDDNSLINVSQERAAELMCKSGPQVLLTVAKDAASYHNLDAILNKSPLPQPTQQQQQQIHHQHHQIAPTTSMPALNNPSATTPIMQPPYHIATTQTLPRSHHLINNNNGYHMSSGDVIQPPLQSSNSMSGGIQMMTNTNEIQQVEERDIGFIKARSMSQDINRASGNNMNNTPSSPINNQPILPPTSTLPLSRPNHLVTSPTNQYHLNSGYPVRTLANEQQVRFGSERPMTAHTQQMQQQQFMSATDSAVQRAAGPPQIAQRNLPNEYVPRFGSERPAGGYMVASNTNNRFQETLSPIKPQLRQASLSEIDEINYNMSKQQQQQNEIEQQQQQPSFFQQQSTRIEDLYGKVNPNRNGLNTNGAGIRPTNGGLEERMAAINQQYKTLPSRTALANQPTSKLKN